ncbi:MAG: methanogenesis marker protein Mmp4/MtxX [Methanobacterium sp.]|nr:methanogenesis marker protein Mmp4/MtxX [Methanobacterium sp.]
MVAGVGDNKNIITASKNVDFEVILTEFGDELVELLLNGSADGAIRGSLSSRNIMHRLEEKYPQRPRASFMDLNGHKLLLAPVGIDDVENLNEKVLLIEKGCQFLKSIGIKPKVGVVSAGREADVGRNKVVDTLMEECVLLTSMITGKSIDVKHYYGIIDEAIKETNFIITSDGNCGNHVFRVMALLCGVKSYGAITFGMDEIYIDTTRSQTIEGFTIALNLANYLAEKKEKNKLIYK